MEKELLELISACKIYLDEKTANEIMHFYMHDEYEMALEGLLIEMIKINKHPEKISRDKIIELVENYQLNIESVFDYNFWGKFLEWVLWEIVE